MIKLIGAGPGNIKLLTLEAVENIKAADYVIAFERIARDISSIREDVLVVTRVDDVLVKISQLDKDAQVVILASGDSCFFGIIDLLKRKNLELDKVLSGISSVQYLFNRLQKSYSSLETRSVHGRDFDFSTIDKNKKYSFLIDEKKNANFISNELSRLGFVGKLYCGYNLSYENEEIIEMNIGEKIIEPSSLGVVVTEFYVD